MPDYRRVLPTESAAGSLTRVITAAAICPHPPLLFRELTGGQDVAADLRRVCVLAVRRLVADADRVLVVGGADTSGRWDAELPPPLRRFGTTNPRAAAPELPLSLGVARLLLDEAGWTGPAELHGVDRHAGGPEVERLAAELSQEVGAGQDRVAVLVLGDGSGRRGEKAPGFLDDRAARLDEDIAAALEHGDAAALAVLDPVLAEELMILGRAAFALLGALVQTAQVAVVQPELCYGADPFGVSYFVAFWPLADPSEC
jgi:hypothetical protein